MAAVTSCGDALFNIGSCESISSNQISIVNCKFINWQQKISWCLSQIYTYDYRKETAERPEGDFLTPLLIFYLCFVVKFSQGEHVQNYVC